jgi:nitrogen fixation/metabolism regulation signal transduction histidine kinase
LKSLLNSSEPEILIDRNRYLLTNQLLENLLVIQIIENKAEALNQNIKIDDEEVINLTSIKFNDHNDAWKEVFIDEINYKFYFLRSSVNPNNIIAVGLQEKDTPVTLFQFFKIFLIFALFILIYGILLVIIKFINNRKISVDFRTKVAFSLIIVSIAPLLLLAFYFRTITNEKNLDTIFYKLNKRAVNIEEYINSRIFNPNQDISQLSELAERDLGINFNLYEENKLVYSSKDDFYKAGLLPTWLSSDIHSKLFVNDQNDILSKQSIESYNYNSIFYKTKIAEIDYVIEVNNLFNSILIPLAISDFDIILFGTYSLASIFIIILSTILANQISLPLRRLTNAAKSASYGDLNLNIQYKRNDEIGDLTNAFNKMLNEIKKMQTDLSAVERETAWKEMAKQVAHEIKNPLTPMKLSIQQLTAAYSDKSPKFDETFLKVSKTILGQIENLKNIASEFSNFARMPIGEMNSVNIKEAINEVSDLFSDEKIKINLVSVNKSIIVLADENHLKRIFINLIRNSIQAQAENINISISSINESVIILISDDGKGIPENILPKIFEKGFTTKKDGMGLGLNLAKRYLTNISGEIEIQSTSKNGTVFRLTLPLLK